MGKLLRRAQFLIRRHRLEAELADEIEAHRAMLQDRFEREGIAPSAAAVASRRALGNLALAREDARGVWVWPALQSVQQDVAYAVRGLRRQPGLAILAIGTLAAAIGLNTSLFNVFSAVVLRPWPVPEADRMVQIFNMAPEDFSSRAGGQPHGFSLGELRYFTDHASTFDGLFAIRKTSNGGTVGEEKIKTAWVTSNFFRVLRVEMERGPGFKKDDDSRGAAEPVVVLSHGSWRRRFGADPDIIGRTIRLEGLPFTIVGVTRPSFTGTSPERVDLWIPFSSVTALRPNDGWVRGVLLKPDQCCTTLAGRLVPGVTRQQAAAELAALKQQVLPRAGPPGGPAVLVTGTSFVDPKNPDAAAGAFAVMLAGVLLVLLLACANVGNLLLARAAARRREMAVRLSIGASRGRLVRQLLTESFVLAGAGGLAGVAIAMWLPPRILDASFSEPLELHLAADAPLLLFTLFVCIVSCAAFGLAPALHATRDGIASAMRTETVLPGTRLALRSVLLSVQVAISVVLLVGASLLVRAVQRASARDAESPLLNIAAVSLDGPGRTYDPQRTRAFAAEFIADLEQAPALRPLALASVAPLHAGNTKGAVRLPGTAEDQYNAVYEVSPGYFDVLGLRFIAGRAFAPADSERTAIVINETMARQHWTVDSAVGQTLFSAQPWGGWNQPGTLHVVGVVQDLRATSDDVPVPTVYQPLSGRSIPQVLIRSPAPGAREAIAAAAVRLDSRMAVRVAPLTERLEARLRTSRVGAAIAGALGGLALVLASVGMFGVFAFWVQQRTPEIGIRMALGARRRQVIALLMASSGRATVAGLVVGLVGAAAASRSLQSYLFGLSSLDPLAYAAVLFLLVLAGLAATFIPARKAASVDPVRALRCE